MKTLVQTLEGQFEKPVEENDVSLARHVSNQLKSNCKEDSWIN